MKTTFLKKALHYRPLSWLALVVRHELATRKENRRYNDWLKSPDYQSHLRFKKWEAEDGDHNLRFDYNLNDSSLVFDVGGYKGEFAAAIFCKYNCEVYVFEPLPQFFNIINATFAHNSRVHPYCFGLSDITGTATISLSDVSSSLFIKDAETVQIQLKSMVEFIQEQNISKVDLLKLNIEGAEYALLEALLDNNLIGIFKNIQVQFHEFLVENSVERMNKIHQRLSKTHRLSWQYEFVWENWELIV
ncbi:MAG TPA: FkbM family methyltransferase [Flavipsychrobacter sp.]|nr:FkbM family methyltransferase [Flavipsychrobacter sp.]